MSRHRSSGSAAAHGQQRTLRLAREGGWSILKWLGGFAAEALIGYTACLLLGSLVLMATWGWHQNSSVTAAAGCALLGLFGYGLRVLTHPGAMHRTTLAAIAGGVTVVVALWLGIVLTYCSCL